MASLSVGDIITIIKIVKDLASTYAGALSHYAELSDTMNALSIVLHQVANSVPHQGLSSEQGAGLNEIFAKCRNILGDLEQWLAAYNALNRTRPGIRGRFETMYRRFTWKQSFAEELRARISNHVILLTCFNNTLLGPKITRLQQFQADQEHQRILQWLSPINPAAQRSDSMKRYQQGTNQWFLSSPAYQKYLEETGKILFCPGKPGAGKTILTSLVAGELISRFSSQAEVGIADIYLSTENEELQTEEGIIAALLKQLVQSLGRIPRRVGIIFEQHKNHGTSMSFEQLWDCLESTISECCRSFILLNAVDECPQTYGLRSRILSRVLSLRDGFKTNVFVTSCDIPDVTKKFSETDTVRICATEADVRRYLRETIQEMPNLSTQRSELINDTISEIAKAVDGIFLLARLHLQSLAGKTVPADIKQTLKALPKGGSALGTSYDNAMRRVENQDPDTERLAKRALSWIVYSKEPLSPLGLCWGLGVRIGQTSLNSDDIPTVDAVCNACAGLVAVDQDSDTVRLIHHTAWLYFEQGSKITSLDQEQTLAQACVTFLRSEGFCCGACRTEQEFARRLSNNPLYGYAARYWGCHALRASGEADELILEFLDNEGCVKAASQVIFDSPRQPQCFEYNLKRANGMPALHLAAYFGLVGPVSVLIQRGQSVNSGDENGNTPLSWAARNGHGQLVEKLLKEPQIDINSKDKEDRGPLSWAVQNGHTEIVQMLLTAEAAADDPDKTGHTPLSLAALHGRADAAEALLQTRNVNVNSPHRNMRTPLAYAAEKGHLVVVETLLKYGSDQNLADSIYNRTPVFRAAWNGHRDVVQRLVENGNCPINHHDKFGWTPLALAVAGGRAAVVEYLLDNSKVYNPMVDPERKTLDNQTPLQIAISRRRVRVVQLFLDKPHIKLGPLGRYGSTSPDGSGSVPDEQETPILQMVRARFSRDGVVLPDTFHLHPATNLENLIYCNVGNHQIPNAEVHYHCDVCENGNFDACQTCVGHAACCINESHKLFKRYVVDGNVVSVDT